MLQRNDNLPEALRKARLKAGYTQEGLAEVVSTSGGAVSNWETGINMPTQKSLDKLNNVLFGGSGNVAAKKKVVMKKTTIIAPKTEKGNSSLSSYETEKLTAELSRRGFKVTLTF